MTSKEAIAAKAVSHLDAAEECLRRFPTRSAPGVPGDLRDALWGVIAHLRALPESKPAKRKRR